MTPTTYSALVRPWGDKWQLWSRNRKSPAWMLARTGEWNDLKIPPDAIYAIPARLTVAYAFYVEAIEESVVREMALLEVEMRGLAPGDRLNTDASIRILSADEKRTLVLAVIYPGEWPAELAAVNAAAFEASPALAVLGDNTLHLWREGNDLVAAVTWKGQLVSWETAPWGDDPRDITSWLRCLVLQLRGDLGITEPLVLKEWTPVFSQTPEGFVRDRGLGEKDLTEGASPALTDPGSWLPQSLRASARQRQERAVLVKSLLALAAVLFVIASGTILAFANLRWQERKIDAEIARLEPEIAPIREAAKRWNRIEAAVDERFFPLEMLNLIVTSLPPAGVRLTVFEMSPQKILVEGEAGNVGTATEFFNRLQQNAGSGGLNWEMPYPSLQANNTARFVINGTVQGASNE
ncbi:MAG: PilN domain-containing protein [Terrimicrobiaceae bacterium]